MQRNKKPSEDVTQLLSSRRGLDGGRQWLLNNYQNTNLLEQKAHRNVLDGSKVSLTIQNLFFNSFLVIYIYKICEFRLPHATRSRRIALKRIVHRHTYIPIIHLLFNFLQFFKRAISLSCDLNTNPFQTLALMISGSALAVDYVTP